MDFSVFFRNIYHEPDEIVNIPELMNIPHTIF